MVIGIKLTDDADGYNWPSAEEFEKDKFDKVLFRNLTDKFCESSVRFREKFAAKMFMNAFDSKD